MKLDRLCHHNIRIILFRYSKPLSVEIVENGWRPAEWQLYRYAAEDPATCSGDDCRTKTFKYIRVKSVLSRKAESAGETPDVRTDCAEFKPVEMRHWASHEAGSPVTCGGEEVTICTCCNLEYVDWSPDCYSVLSGKKNNRCGLGGLPRVVDRLFPISVPLRTL